MGLGVAIYANFFTNHHVPDVRWALMAGVLVIFRRATVHFTVTTAERRLPMVAASQRPPRRMVAARAVTPI